MKLSNMTEWVGPHSHHPWHIRFFLLRITENPPAGASGGKGREGDSCHLGEVKALGACGRLPTGHVDVAHGGGRARV